MFYGARVVRGPDWQWEDQDGGPGHVGTLIVPDEQYIDDIDSIWVHWDDGTSANYHGDKENGYDLHIYDNGQLGVKHNDIQCDACKRLDIDGFRWKCVKCDDFDLCTNCYMSDNHDTSHPFQRIDVPRANPVKLGVREDAKKLKAKGIFPGATVKRGLKWEWEDQDGGKGQTGDVTHLDNWCDNTYRTKVKVKWSHGKSNVYRLGYNGCVDIIYVKGKEGHGGYFYPEHLPVLDFEKTPNFITPGDKVCVKNLSRGVFEKAQKEIWKDGLKEEMMDVLGKEGDVKIVDKDGDIKVDFSNGQSCYLNPLCLLPKKKSDKGRVNDKALALDSRRKFKSHASDLIRKLKVLDAVSSTRQDADTLRSACAKGDVYTVKEIIKKNPSWVHKGNEDKGYKPLHLASHQGHYEIVEALVSANADIEATDNDGQTALVFSAFGNKPSVTRFLLKKGGQVNAKNKHDRSSLHIAAGQGHSACVAALLSHPEIQVNLQDITGMTPMMKAIESNDEATMGLLADEPNVDFTIRNKNGFNSLHYAAFRGSTYVVNKIISKSSSIPLIEDKKPDGYTSLHLAAINNHTGVAKALVNRGADINCRNNKMETPLHLACNEGLNDTIEFLVNGRANVNLQDEDGDTPLHTMLMQQSVRDIIGSKLGEMRSKVSESSQGDKSGRNIAAIAVYLIKNGADIYLRNHKGKTVLDCVGNSSLQDMLKNIHAKDRLKALHRSISTGSEDECIIS